MQFLYTCTCICKEIILFLYIKRGIMQLDFKMSMNFETSEFVLPMLTTRGRSCLPTMTQPGEWRWIPVTGDSPAVFRSSDSSPGPLSTGSFGCSTDLHHTGLAFLLMAHFTSCGLVFSLTIYVAYTISACLWTMFNA